MSLKPVAIFTPAANLPPVSTTLVKLVAKFAASVIDTSGKFATGVVDTGGSVVDTGGKFAAHVVYTCGQPELPISPQVFEKIRKGPNSILKGLEETDS
jgi:hypothetical protein